MKRRRLGPQPYSRSIKPQWWSDLETGERIESSETVWNREGAPGSIVVAAVYDIERDKEGPARGNKYRRPLQKNLPNSNLSVTTTTDGK